MGVLCHREGPQIYASTRDIILEGVRSNLERQPIGDAAQEVDKLVEKLSSSPTEVGNLCVYKNLDTKYSVHIMN